MTTTGEPVGAGPGLVGREPEIALLHDFLRRATRSGGTQLVVGDPGMGKSALLDAAADAARDSFGARVLRASGVEFEPELVYSGLNQLLLPVADQLDGMPAADVSPLGVVLGRGSDRPPELLGVTTATVRLLQHVARDRPLVLVVDDLQWVDRASLLLLSLVARRLDGTRVALLLAQRAGYVTYFDRDAIPAVELSALPDEDAHQVLRAHHPDLHPTVRHRIVAEAGGNPLALIELPRSLTAAQGSAVDVLPGTLPLGTRLRRLFASRVSALPTPSRRLLLLAALHHGDATELLRVVAGSAADLEPAETARLASVDPATHQLRFSHPLVRAAVVDLATPPERRAAHRRLAALASDPHVRALHLADAALGVSDEVAALLDDVAEAALRSGATTTAVEVLLRAADLTAAPPDRARRLASAAYLATTVTGALAGAPALLTRARSADPNAVGTLQLATAAAAHLLNSDAAIDTAHQMLTRALAAVAADDVDPRVLREALHTLMLVCGFGGRPQLWTAFTDTVGRTAAVLPPELTLAAVTFADPARATGEQLTALDELVAAADGAADPVQVLEVALAGHFVDREPTAALDRVVEAGRAGGPVALAAQALAMRATTAFHEGRWADAAELGDEAIALCREHGYQLLEWGAMNPRMLLAAVRGDTVYLDDARRRMHQWAIPRRMLAARTFTANVDGLAALSAARHGEAYEAYRTIGEPGTVPPYAQVAVRNVLDVVEAAVRSGHPAAARRHAAVAASTLAPISPRLRFEAAAAAAVVAPEDAYRAAFDLLVDDPGTVRWPFPLARLELLYGERLRLGRAMRQARPHLERAAELFDRLDAGLWKERAEATLRATGGTRASADDRPGDEALTPQELRICRLAASGLSNREIGEQLHLSPRTVGAHLYRAFPKLAITSRAALRDALDGRGL